MNGKKHGRKGGIAQYFIKTLCYLLILLAVTVATVFITINPVTQLVHKIEDRFPMGVNDIQLNDMAYQPLSVDSVDSMAYSYGDKLAVISSDDFGLNCPVYYGANRVSMEQGVGFSSETDLFADKGISLVVGYMQSCFSSLEYAQVGDLINVVTNYGEFSYRVYSIEYIDESKQAYKDIGSDRLVLCGLTSDFSEHSKESLYVFCELVPKGVE